MRIIKIFCDHFYAFANMEKNTGINGRFVEIINRLYAGNKRAFAQQVGISPTVIENVVGTRQGKPSYDVLEKVCANANISAEWLLSGKGSMIRDEDTQMTAATIQSQFTLRTDRRVDVQSVPLYELDATAGLVTLFAEQGRLTPISHIQIPDLPPCDGAVYVRGDSMYPLLKSGDIVLYKEIPNGSSGILWGEMYLLSSILTARAISRSSTSRKQTTIGLFGSSATIRTILRRIFPSIPSKLLHS